MRKKVPYLSKDPLMVCFVMWPTDPELINDDLKDKTGFFHEAAKIVRKRRSAEEIVEDILSCGFNAAATVGFLGSNLKPEDIYSSRYRKFVNECHRQGISVGHSLPFADTIDNSLTTSNPKLHQILHNGEKTYICFNPQQPPPFLLYNIDYGAKGFIDFAKKVIDACSEVGVNFIDYGEPDFWPAEENGYHYYLSQAYRQKFKEDLPFPTNIKHRNFMENYHLKTLDELSHYIQSKGMTDHLTASPLAHSPHLICQNYGKYSNTSIKELSSTYHFPYGLGLSRLSKEVGVNYEVDQIAGVACVEVKYMRSWEERHATYLGVGQGYPLETYQYALDEQLFLHNMDVFFWDYPGIKETYYQNTEPWRDIHQMWKNLQKIYREKFTKYRELPQEYFSAKPLPELLVLYSKRGEYIKKNKGHTVRCFYNTALKLQMKSHSYGVLYPEYLKPLKEERVNMILIDEHHPLPPDFWKIMSNWIRKGRVIIYCGGPGFDWETGGKLREFSKEFQSLFGIQYIGQKKHRDETPTLAGKFSKFPPYLFSPKISKIDILSEVKVITRENDIPFITVKGDEKEGYAIYITASHCQLLPPFLDEVLTYFLNLIGKKMVEVESILNIEICLYRFEKDIFIAARNHSSLTSQATFYLKAHSFTLPTIKELICGKEIIARQKNQKYEFTDVFNPKKVKIYRLQNRYPKI